MNDGGLATTMPAPCSPKPNISRSLSVGLKPFDGFVEPVPQSITNRQAEEELAAADVSTSAGLAGGPYGRDNSFLPLTMWPPASLNQPLFACGYLEQVL